MRTMPPETPVAKHQVQGYTFVQLCEIAEAHDYIFEYHEDDGEGGGDEYELCSNKHSFGTTGVYDTLAEAAADVISVGNGEHPL